MRARISTRCLAALLVTASTLTPPSLQAQEPAAGPDRAPGPDTVPAARGPGPDPVRDWGGIRYFAEALASDGWAVVTAPLRLDRDGWMTLGGAVAVGALLLPFDEPLWEGALRSHDHAILGRVEDVGKFLEPVSLMGRTNKYYAGGMAAGYAVDFLTGEPRLRWMFEELLISNWLAGLTRKAVGRPIGRYRPESGRGAYHFVLLEGTSFPSGHASTITQLATVLSHHIDWWPASVVLYAGAAAVMYERVADSEHWASDAWWGAAWGWGISRVVIRRREANRRDFVPVFDFATGAAGVRVPVGF